MVWPILRDVACTPPDWVASRWFTAAVTINEACEAITPQPRPVKSAEPKKIILTESSSVPKAPEIAARTQNPIPIMHNLRQDT